MSNFTVLVVSLGMFDGARPLFTVAVAANSEQQRETTALQNCQEKKKLSSSNELSLKCSQ